MATRGSQGAKGSGSDIVPPATLSKNGIIEWNRITSILKSKNISDLSSDYYLILSMVQNLEIMTYYQEQIPELKKDYESAKKTLNIADSNERQKLKVRFQELNNCVEKMNRCITQNLLLSDKLGLNPKTRKQMKVDESKKDPLEEFLTRRKG